MEPIGDSIKQGQEQRTRNIKHLKQFVLGLLSASAIILNWWLIREAMFSDAGAGYWAWPILATGVWIVLVSFFALINPDRWTFFTFNAAGLVAYLVLMPRDIYVFIGGILFFLISLLFQARLQEEEKNQLNFSIRRTLGNSQAIMTYGILVMVGFMLYSNIQLDFRRDPEAFYQRMAQTAVKGLPYVSRSGASFNLNQSMGEFFRRQAEGQYPEFNQVSAAQQRALTSSIRDEFSRQFGIDADENVSLRVAMVEVVTERLRETLGRYERFFPLVFTFLVIALLRTVTFVFNWAVLILSWLMFRFLLAVRFFRLEKQTVEVEKLEI